MLAIKYTPTAKCSKCVYWKIGNNYFQINLFCIYWGRSTAFISHSSLIYSRGTYENSTRKHFEPTKVPTRKKIGPKRYPRQKIWYPREKTLNPQNTHHKKLRTREVMMAQWHEAHKTHNGTRPTEVRILSKFQPKCHYF